MKFKEEDFFFPEREDMQKIGAHLCIAFFLNYYSQELAIGSKKKKFKSEKQYNLGENEPPSFQHRYSIPNMSLLQKVYKEREELGNICLQMMHLF